AVEHLLEVGAEAVLVIGRRDRDRKIDALLERWGRRRAGDRVRYVSCDVRNLESLRAALVLPTDAPPLQGITYSVASLLDKSMAAMSWDDFQTVALPRCLGLLNLHRATLELALQHFVVFSSAVTLGGTKGQASYAAASAFLDAFTEHRKALGLPVVTVDWGVWSETGLVEGRRDLHREVREAGFGLIDNALGRRLLEAVYRERSRRLVMMPLDVDRLLAASAAYEPLLVDLRKGRLVVRQG